MYVYIYWNGILISHKKWNNAVYSNMDGPRDYHTKWGIREKCHITSLLCGIENATQMNIPMKQKKTYKNRGETCGC